MNSRDINSKKLIQNIQKVFVDQDKYLFDKHVPEFTVDGKCFGDCFSMIMIEPRGDRAPRFYHTFSPFDVISNKAPDHALVFEKGKLVLNADFTELVKDRTGAMDTVLLMNLGVSSLKDKKVLYVGSGGTALASLRILKAHYSELSAVDCINKSRDFSTIKRLGNEIKVNIAAGSYKDIGKYDFIFCHTDTVNSLLTKEMKNKINHGAVITTYNSSTEHGEVADEFYDNQEANIIADWKLTLTGAKDLARAVKGGSVQEKDVIFLADLIMGTKKTDSSKRYTVYRSAGTPMQNLAVLQLQINK